MSKVTKMWLIIATSLVVLGFIMFTAVMMVYNWDFTKLSTVQFEINTYAVSEEFSNISMNTDTADILFVPSEDDKCKVVCYEMQNAKHSVAIQDGTLTINVVDEREWYEYIGITLGTPKITVYLPETEYSSIIIKVSTGDVTLSNVTCEGDIKIKVSTGKTNLIDIKCNNLISSGSTGDISLKNSIATEKFSVERSTGDVDFDDCDAAEIFVKTSTGHVKGSLLTDKVFLAQTDTGSIDVPATTTGGKCEINTDTGNIRISISY